MHGFKSKYIFDGITIHEDKVVVIEDSKIIDMLALDKVGSNIQVREFGEGIIAPGFIDLQLNGCGGVLFNDDISCNTLEVMYQTWHKFGCTGFLPTLITTDFTDVIKALNITKEWILKYGNRRGVLGLHLEGPFISKVKNGIHPRQYIISPQMNLLQQIVEFTEYFPIKMTIAIEEFTEEQLQFLLKHGVILSIGHSNADYATVKKGIDIGITTSTHMFNAMSGLTARNPGVIGAILNNKIYTGVIADMLHVDAANIELLCKSKPDQAYLVTDAVTPTGTNLTEFEFGGELLHVKDGKCIDSNGVLGGACLTMNEAVKNVVKYCNLSLPVALTMASLIPAQVLNLDNKLGKISPGYLADLIYMDLGSFKCEICQ